MADGIDLNGTWELTWQDGERGPGKAPGVMGLAGVMPPQSFPARVPGEVHLDLMAAGVLDEPTIGLNCLKARWVEEVYWIYRRSFTIGPLEAGARVYLRFDRLELAATVRLNGSEVGRHANAFLPACFEVTGSLRPGENLLTVEIESGLFSAGDRPWEGWGANDGVRLTKRHWLRTVQSSAGWDWSQRLLNIGITGGVRLEICRGFRIDGFALIPDLDQSLTAGTLCGRLFLEGLDSTSGKASLLLDIRSTDGASTEVQEETSFTVQTGAQRLQVDARIPRPRLWWPRGHGEQSLYEARLRLRIGDTVVFDERRLVGFRHVRVNQERLAEGGRSFVIEINGRPVFCKGGDFVPADPISARITAARYQQLVARALEANFTMLRVWGGGLYESDDFYRLCDQAGILTWQEFIFACAKYPSTEAGFLDSVRAEARHQARRLSHHPSLVVWCGNNELEWGDWSWGYGERSPAAPDHFLFHTVLPRILQEEDGTRFYQPSSPYSPDLHHPNCDDCGDQHPWSIGFKDNDFRKYRLMACRFPNEGGIMGPTSLPTIRSCLVPGQDHPHSFSWEVHENSIATPSSSDAILEQWLGVRLQDLGIEEWTYLGGLLQGLGLSEYIRNFRRRMFATASAVFWMYNDCWPMVRSWTIVDHGLRRTPAFHPVRRAFAPLSVALAAEAGQVRVYAVNDGPEIEVDLRYGLCALRGGYPLEERRAARLPSNASTLLGEFAESRWKDLGERTHVAFAVLSAAGQEVARDVLILPFYREMEWPEARVEIHRTGPRAVFSSDSFAWRVCVDLDGEKPYPDNFFDLLPGVPHALEWPASLGEPRVLRAGNVAMRGQVKRI